MKGESTVLLVCIVCGGGFAAAEHRLKATPKTGVIGHYSPDTPPVLRIQSGDTVEIETVSNRPASLEAAGVRKDRIPAALYAIEAGVKDRGPGGHIPTGPIYIEGAEPGDVLEVRILDVRMDLPYAYNVFGPSTGALQEDFPYRRRKLIPLDRQRMVGQFAPGIEIPLRPFFGSMGVAAYMLASVAVDFSLTQIVDGKVGVHGMIAKSLFRP